MEDAKTFIEIVVIGAGVLGLYLLPTIVAHKKRSGGGIFILNLALGWTVLGWLP